MKKVGIVIVNWNSLKLGYAQDLVSSLNKINYPLEDYKIFISDNLSKDGSAEYFEKNLNNAVVIYNEDNLGFAEGNNRVVDRLIKEGYDYAYLLNQDTKVDPDFLLEVVKVMEEDEKIGAVQSRLMLHPSSVPGARPEDNICDVINSIGNAIHYLGFGYSLGGYEQIENYNKEDLDKQEIGYASGAGVLLKLKVIARVGLFDKDFFMYHEDLDLGWRISLAGYKNVLSYDSVVYHKYKFPTSKFYYMERNRYIVLFENYRWMTLLVLFPALLSFEIGLFFFSILSGFYKDKIKSYLYFLKLSSWQKIFRRRREKKKYRQVKDRQVMNHFVGTIANQHINNPILSKIANPIFNLYFHFVKLIIFW